MKKERVTLKTIKLTASEIRTLKYFLYSNPCSSGCAYPEMQSSKKDCAKCKLRKDMYSIMTKLEVCNHERHNILY